MTISKPKKIGLFLSFFLFVLVFVFLLLNSASLNEANAYCSGDFSCGAIVATCTGTDIFGGPCSASECSSGNGTCHWTDECDDGFQTRSCSGSSGPQCNNSASCSIFACSGPNAVTCSWVDLPPTPTSAPTATLAPGVSATPSPAATPTPGGTGCGDPCSDDQQCPEQPSRLCVGAPNGNCYCDGGTPVVNCDGIEFSSGYSESDLYGSASVSMRARNAGNYNLWDAKVDIRISNEYLTPSEWEFSCSENRDPSTGGLDDRTCWIDPTVIQPLNPGDKVYMSLLIEDGFYGNCPIVFQMPDRTGHLIGRVYVDANANGAYDTGEVFVESTSSSCGGSTVQLDSVFIQADGPMSATVENNRDSVSGLPVCNAGGPHYQLNWLTIGDYTVYLNESFLPTGWAPSNPPQSATVPENDFAHVWFGIKQISCQMSVVSPLVLAVGGEVNLQSAIAVTNEINGNPPQGVDEVRMMIQNPLTADFDSDPSVFTNLIIDNNPAGGIDGTLYGNSVGNTNILVTGEMIDEGGVMCTPDPAVINVEVVDPPGWWQVKEGDIIAGNGSITNPIPNVCASNPILCDPYTIIHDAENSVGVAMSGGQVTTGSGTVSDMNWMTENSPYSGDAYDYNYFRNRISPVNEPYALINTTVNEGDLTTGGTNVGGYYVYKYEGVFDLVLSASDGAFNLGNRKVILFVENLVNTTIETPIHFIDGRGYFAIFTPGDISIDPLVGGSAVDLEGLFYADGQFGSGTAGYASDVSLTLRGVVSAGSFNLTRDLAGPTRNAYDPAEIFVDAIDIRMNFPSFLSKRSIDWKEVSP